MLREEQSLYMSENKALRKIFMPKKEGMANLEYQIKSSVPPKHW
jgi:hypothetical protein